MTRLNFADSDVLEAARLLVSERSVKAEDIIILSDTVTLGDAPEFKVLSLEQFTLEAKSDNPSSGMVHKKLIRAIKAVPSPAQCPQDQELQVARTIATQARSFIQRLKAAEFTAKCQNDPPVKALRRDLLSGALKIIVACEEGEHDGPDLEAVDKALKQMDEGVERACVGRLSILWTYLVAMFKEFFNDVKYKTSEAYARSKLRDLKTAASECADALPEGDLKKELTRLAHAALVYADLLGSEEADISGKIASFKDMNDEWFNNLLQQLCEYEDANALNPKGGSDAIIGAMEAVQEAFHKLAESEAALDESCAKLKYAERLWHNEVERVESTAVSGEGTEQEEEPAAGARDIYKESVVAMKKELVELKNQVGPPSKALRGSSSAVAAGERGSASSAPAA